MKPIEDLLPEVLIDVVPLIGIPSMLLLTAIV
jgi:hypothetical protein